MPCNYPYNASFTWLHRHHFSQALQLYSFLDQSAASTLPVLVNTCIMGINCLVTQDPFIWALIQEGAWAHIMTEIHVATTGSRHLPGLVLVPGYGKWDVGNGMCTPCVCLLLHMAPKTQNAEIQRLIRSIFRHTCTAFQFSVCKCPKTPGAIQVGGRCRTKHSFSSSLGIHCTLSS
jgi:hypothetical protein